MTEPSFLAFFTFAAYYVLLKALMLVIVARFPDTAIGRAVGALS